MGSSQPSSQRGYQVQGLQSQCYLNLARQMKDRQFCDRVVPVRVKGLNGSGFDQAYCLAHLDGAVPYLARPDRMDVFGRLIHKLSYSDEQIQKSPYRRDNRYLPADVGDEDYWQFFSSLASWGSPQDRAEFLKRVMRLTEP